MSGITQILTLADAYVAAEGIELNTLSWRVFEDTKKLGAMKAGADIQVRRAERALSWFSAHWPDGVDWPADVPRPVEQERQAS